MNDRYLYRAMRVDNGEWVEGAYYIEPYTDKYFIIQWNSTGLGFNEFIEVDGASVCQCTGLKDKNDKLIWENDIVKEFNSSGDEWNLSQIVFGEYSLNLGWCAKGIKTLHEYNRRLFNVGFGASEAGKCETIGNIFDNPELLEEKEYDDLEASVEDMER